MYFKDFIVKKWAWKKKIICSVVRDTHSHSSVFKFALSYSSNSALKTRPTTKDLNNLAGGAPPACVSYCGLWISVERSVFFRAKKKGLADGKEWERESEGGESICGLFLTIEVARNQEKKYFFALASAKYWFDRMHSIKKVKFKCRWLFDRTRRDCMNCTCFKANSVASRSILCFHYSKIIYFNRNTILSD